MIINNPIVVRLCSILDELEEEPLRAVYMVAEQLHRMQTSMEKAYHTGDRISTKTCKEAECLGNCGIYRTHRKLE